MPKGKKVRSVPLLPEVAARLDAIASRPYWTGPDDLVFVNVVGGAIDPSKTGKAYRKALTAAGLRPIRFHDLRHTFGTLGVQVWELTKVQGYMGHTNIQTTMRYVHHVPNTTTQPSSQRWFRRASRSSRASAFRRKRKR